MDSIYMLLALASSLFGVVLALVGVVYAIHRQQISELKLAKDDHDRRLIVLEQTQLHRFAQLQQEVGQIHKDVKQLADYVHTQVHAENNTMHQMKAFITEQWKKIKTD